MNSQLRAQAPLESAIYQGFVRHRRFGPVRHEFRYPLHMVFLKLDELPQALESSPLLGTGRWNWARFRRADYIDGNHSSLADAVRGKLGAKLGLDSGRLAGDIYFLGHLRYAGIYFSPLNLYFLAQQGRMRFMLAEVSNTPWNQRHYYAIDLDGTRTHAKEFHVSPFNPMSQSYRWQVRPPTVSDSKATVQLDVMDGAGGHPVFDATLVLKRLPLNHRQMLNVVLATPVQTLSMVVGIYWQAFRLYLKGVRYHPHPARANASAAGSEKA